jgi:hypothetical protein
MNDELTGKDNKYKPAGHIVGHANFDTKTTTTHTSTFGIKVSDVWVGGRREKIMYTMKRQSHQDNLYTQMRTCPHEMTMKTYKGSIMIPLLMGKQLEVAPRE